MIAGAMCIASAMQDAATGISVWFEYVLTPLVAGRSGIMIYVMIWFCALVMTNFCNNAATAVVFSPIAFNMVQASGADVNLAVLFTGLSLITAVAFVAPSGGSPAALLHSNRSWVSAKYCISMSIIYVLFVLLGCIVIGIPLGNILF